MNAHFLSKTAAFARPLGAALFCLALLAPLLSSLRAEAAGLADDHTVLYYLIEMHRRHSRTCDGAPMPEAPSLIPSEALRGLAEQSASSGQRPETVIASAGLSAVPHFATVIPGPAPKQALAALLATQCRSVMGQDYQYIGAALRNGQWTLILSAAEPGQIPAAQAVAPPRLPGSAASPADPSAEMAYALPSAPAPVVPARPDPLPPQPTGPAGATLAGAALAGQPLPASPSGPAGSERAGVADNPAPAAPVVVGEMTVSATGEYLSPTWEPQAPVLPPGAASPPLSPPPQEGQVPLQAQPGAPSSAQAAPRPSRPGVTPLYDERSELPAAGIGVFAEAVPAPEATIPPAPAVPPASSGASGAQLAPRAVPAPQAASPAVTAPLGSALPARVDGAPQSGDAQDERLQSARMLRLVNAARTGGHVCGETGMPAAPALKSNAPLAAAASAHARDMTARRYFSSTTPETRTLGQRVSGTGYSWAFVAENIAARTASPEQVLQSWLANPEQCRNIMGREYLDAGIGFDPAGPHWVITLAAPFETGLPGKKR